MVGIIIAILVFSFLVITHELGHFLFAKKCGIGVIEFSVGMGPRIASFVKGETRYSLKLIPFGGSCAMVGEDDESDADNAFGKKSVWARILVVVGGPMFNLITAFILSLILIAGGGANPAKVYRIYDGYGAADAGLQSGDVITKINGRKIAIGRDIDLTLLNHPLTGDPVSVEFTRDGQKQTITYDPHYTTYRLGFSYTADDTPMALLEVSAGSASEAAGLKAGDVITAIDGNAVATGAAFQEYILANPPDGSPIEITYERGGETLPATVNPVFYEDNILGFEASGYREKTSVGGVIAGAWHELGYWIRYTITSLKLLVTGRVSVRNMSGPVGIVSTISQTVESSSSDGIWYIILNVLNISILLSANLGVLNLLPLPALDGGRLIFLLLEALRGKPIPPEKEGMVHTAGFVLLMVLMVFVLFNDVLRIFGLGG